MKKILTLLGCLLVLSALAVGLTTVHAAQISSSSRPSVARAKTYPTYVVHGIPGVPVDVYLNDKLVLSNFQPLTVAGPFNLPDDSYKIALYPVGAKPSTRPIYISSIIVQSSFAPVSVIAQLNPFSQPTVQTYLESNSFYDVPGKGMLGGRIASVNPIPGYFICYAPVNSSFYSPLSNIYLLPGQYTVFVSRNVQCTQRVISTVVTVKVEINSIVNVVGDEKAGTLNFVIEEFPDQGDPI